MIQAYAKCWVLVGAITPGPLVIHGGALAKWGTYVSFTSVFLRVVLASLLILFKETSPILIE